MIFCSEQFLHWHINVLTDILFQSVTALSCSFPIKFPTINGQPITLHTCNPVGAAASSEDGAYTVS
jgi:hypothetical protein